MVLDKRTSSLEGHEKFVDDFHNICETTKDKIAITYYRKSGAPEECTYQDMHIRVCNLSLRYSTLGIRRGDRVAVLIPLCTNAYLDILALAYLGATSVILDINMHESELMRILNDADVSCIITTKSLYDKKMNTVSVPVFDESDECRTLREGTVCHASDPDYEAIAILYSSGTTSNAKGVVIGYNQEMTAMDHLLKVVGTSDIRYLMLFPNSHVSGFTDFLVLLLRGGQLATMEEASATQLVQGFHLYRPNTFGMVPKVWETFKNKIEDGIREKGEKKAKTIFSLIEYCGIVREKTGINLGRKLFHSINEEVFGGNLQSVHSGGGRSNPEVMRFFWNLGYDCFDFYASTEANIPILVTDGAHFMKSVGNIYSNPNAEIRIANPNQEGIGEVLVKSSTMMRGYFRNESLTNEAFMDGFFRTGDYGKIVDDELYITGRMKESIHLRNGEKISPEDIEESYNQYLNKDIDFAVVGVPDGEEFDKVCLFVIGKEGEFDSDFERVNRNVAINYQYKKIVYVDAIPKTSVGKVKRFVLKNQYMTGNKGLDSESVNKGSKKKTAFEKPVNKEQCTKMILDIICEKLPDHKISLDDKLQNDLSLDSLSIFEICMEIEKRSGIDVISKITADTTVNELIAAAYEKEEEKDNKSLNSFPVKRSQSDWKYFEKIVRWSRKHYDIKVTGLGNLDEECNYIFTPNHESHLDGMWMMSVLPPKMQKRMISMAADYLFKDKFLRKGTVIMGGIPVDRSGNPGPAMKRIYDLLSQGKYSLLIHPEGTRTRDGELGEFKTGAAELSRMTGIKVVPVGIEGAREIYPPDKKLPRIDKKYKLTINFGKPLDSANYANSDIFTEKIRNSVEKLINSGEGEPELDRDLLKLLKSITGCKEIDPDFRLKEDLGLDSLALLELLVQLEKQYNIPAPQDCSIYTVRDLVKYITLGEDSGNSINYLKYPAARTNQINKYTVDMMHKMSRYYDISVTGLENVPGDTNCIFSSNHASYLDPLWMLTAFGESYVTNRKFACLAAVHTMKNKKFFDMLGCIPVEREGNTLPAFNRVRKCLYDGYDMIIFPEGARSRDGSMLPFKEGVAKLAIQCNVPVVPIKIIGGFEIFPRTIKRPRIRKRNGKKYELRIIIGKPLYPEGMNSQQFTKYLYQIISEME